MQDDDLTAPAVDPGLVTEAVERIDALSALRRTESSA